MAWYLISTKAKGLRFKILQLDKGTMKATLQGDTGIPFDRDISQATLEKYGYRVAKVEEEATDEAVSD